VHGLLLHDPTDAEALAAALGRLLGDPVLAEALGQAAHERAREELLGMRSLVQYAELLLDELAIGQATIGATNTRFVRSQGP